jgi:V/A-type H+-transporting ATPase subunit I
MKRVWVFTTEQSRTDTVERLKDIGVIHVQTQEVRSDRLAKLLDRRQVLERGMQVLPLEGKSDLAGAIIPDDPVDTALESARELIGLQDRLNSLMETADHLRKDEISVAPWGNFNPDDIRFLRGKGIFIRLYSITPEQFTRFPEEARLIVLHRAKKLIRCLAITDNDDVVYELDEFPLPVHGLEAIRSRLEANVSEQKELRAEIANRSASRYLLQEAIDRLDGEIEFETVQEGMAREGMVRFLWGYVPEPSLDQLRLAAKEHAWGLIITDPSEEDEVPTVTRNPRWIRIIQPLFQLLGTVPGYFERDISLWFLGFFTVFFAMIIGDAGYGFIILSLTVWGAVRSRRSTGRIADVWILMTVMSVATITWGTLTGTWFGLESIANAFPFRNLTVPQLSIFNIHSKQAVQFICFLLAVVQLSLAHIWNIITEIRGKYPIRALAQFGWLLIVLGAYNVALSLVISKTQYPIMNIAWYAAGVGLLLVLLFGEQAGQFLKGLKSGLNVARVFTTLLNSISAFADIVSYIRLFAVGLATVAIAQSFNSMAAGMAHGGVVGVIGAVVVILLGHTLNLLMGALAIIVHGVRLNVLEFSNHLGLEWKGTPYHPFARSSREQSA